jgi:hypothetical protein
MIIHDNVALSHYAYLCYTFFAIILGTVESPNRIRLSTAFFEQFKSVLHECICKLVDEAVWKISLCSSSQVGEEELPEGQS